MGKEFKNIDDLYQAELGGEMHTVPEHIKSNIDESLGFNTSRKTAFIWLSIVFIGGIITIPFINQTDTQTPLVDTAITAPQNFYSDAVELDLESTDINALVENPSSHKHTINSKNNGTSQNTIQISERKNANSKNSVDNKSKKYTSTPLKTEEVQTNSTESKENSSSASIVNQYRTEEQFENKQINTSKQVNHKRQIKAELDDINTPLIETMDSSSITAQVPESSTDTKKQNLNKDKNADITRIAELDSAHIPALIPIDPNLKKIKSQPWMLTLTTGFNKVNSSYSANTQHEKTIYENAGTDQIGKQTNFDFTYRLNNGLTFGSGLGYTKFEEEFNFKRSIQTTRAIESFEYEYGYNYDYVEEIIYDEVSGAIIDTILVAVDSTYGLLDTNSVYSVEKSIHQRDVRGTNKVTYVHIPISFGTQMNFNRIQLDLYAALRFNIRTNSEGIYQKNDAFYSFTDRNSIYRKFYTDIALGVRLHYNFWSNLYFSSTLQYRPVIGKSLGTSTFNKSFDYTHIGIGLGIRL